MVLPHVDTERFTLQRVAGMAEYQRWFAYGVDPEGTPITDQDRASLWDAEQHQGVDLTHQLFAHYFYLLAPHAVAKPLHPDSERKKFMAQLALRIHQEATLDFRVSDLFLQRIATLLMIGRADLVEPRWVERVMTNQLADGGWRWSWKGWGPGRWSIGSPNSPSHQHPTMQAAWLLTQIRHRYPQWVDQHYPSDG